jgi:hypothetical protein
MLCPSAETRFVEVEESVLLIPEDDSQQNDLVLQTRLRTVISRNI